jgi:hypothetical protein
VAYANILKANLKSGNPMVSQLLGVVPAGIIVVVNIILKGKLEAIADWEVHWTQTGQEASYTRKFIRAQFYVRVSVS